MITTNPHTDKFFPVLRTFKIYSLNKFQYSYNTASITIVTMLYLTFPELIYKWKFSAFDHLSAFKPHPSPPACFWQPPVCSLYLWVWSFVLFCFVLDSTYKRTRTVFAFLWLISLSMVPSKSIHDVGISFLWLKNVPVCVCVCVCVCVYLSIYLLYPLVDM